LFAHLAITVTIALFASLCVALFLIPALHTIRSQRIHHTTRHKNFWAIVTGSIPFHKVDSLLQTIEHHYITLLNMLLSQSKYIYTATVAIILLGICSVCIISKSLMPQTKQSHFTIRLEAPPGTTLQQTVDMLSYIDALSWH